MDAFEPTAPLPNGASVEGKKELPAIKSEPEDANKGMIWKVETKMRNIFNIIWQEQLIGIYMAWSLINGIIYVKIVSLI